MNEQVPAVGTVCSPAVSPLVWKFTPSASITRLDLVISLRLFSEVDKGCDHKKIKSLENMFYGVWGRRVTQQAHAEAFLPPGGTRHRQNSIEESLFRAWGGELRGQ